MKTEQDYAREKTEFGWKVGIRTVAVLGGLSSIATGAGIIGVPFFAALWYSTTDKVVDKFKKDDKNWPSY